MTNYKNDLPLYAEEQTIQQKIKIPSNFIELGQPKKYWGSTAGLDKPLCERYNFKHNDKTIVLDISQKLIEKFGLKEKEIHSFGVYINKNLLKKTPEEGGITIDKEKDIICQTKGIILVQEKGNQVDFTSGEITDLKQKLKKSEELSQETQKFLEILAKDNEEKHIAIIFFEEQIKNLTQRITELRQDLENEILDRKREENKNRELERIIKKLKEDEQVLIGLQNNFTQLQTDLGNQITTLTTEKDRIQEELNNLKDKLKRIQKNFLGSLFRSGKKSNEIKGLKVERVWLRAQLNDKEQELNKWTTQFPNQQTPETVQGRINVLNDQLTTANNTINQRDTQITNLTNKVNSLNDQISTDAIELIEVRGELIKEKLWWHWWINDKKKLVTNGSVSNELVFIDPASGKSAIPVDIISLGEYSEGFKLFLRDYIYRYYRDK